MPTGPGRNGEIALKERLFTTLADVAAFLRFFTRLPVPLLGPLDRVERAPDFARAGWLMPLVGLIAALPAALVGLAALFLRLPAPIAAFLALAAGVATTGALHEDGLADVADGFGGGRTVAQKLEIMKDSRVGSYGVVALVLALGLRAAALAALMTLEPPLGFAVVVLAAGAISRVLMLVPFAVLGNARGSGLAAGFVPPGAAMLRIWLPVEVLAIVFLTALLTRHAGVPALVILPAGAVAAIVVLARRQIGGHTGDVLGATQQLTEIAVLIAALIPV